jgi:hypothetical protein
MMDGADYNQEWKACRRGKITSSNAWKLCQEKGWGDVGMGYIRSRAYELLSGVSSDTEINTEATINGLIQEGPGLRKYVNQRGLNGAQLVMQKLIYGSDPMYASTPDGIYCMNESTDGLYWNVESWEMKAYGVLKHMENIEATNPQDLKDINRALYFQVLDQMSNVECLIGRAIFFNSELPEDKGGLHVVDFNKMQREVDSKGKTTFPIAADLKFLETRKQMAKEEILKRVNKYN